MANDPVRNDQLRAAGFAAVVDTEDPPGKVTVVFDLADFDALIRALVAGDPVEILKARTEAYQEGRSDAEAVAYRNARAQVARELVTEGQKGPVALAVAVTELARAHSVDPSPKTPDPRVAAALLGRGPADAQNSKGRLRT